MTPRHAVFAAFVPFGIGFGMWAGTIARVAARSDISAQMLGFAITGFIAAALSGMALGGMLSRHFTVKTILLGAIAACAISLSLLMQADGPFSFLLGLIVYGVINGIYDGAMNAEGTAVEADCGRPILLGFHAAASCAAGLTAIIGSYVAVNVGTEATAGIVVCGYALGALGVWRGTPARVVAIRDAEQKNQPRRFQRPILLLGIVVGIVIAGETVTAMFSAPALVAQAPDLAAYAGFGATAFALCQALVRAFADRLRRRFGDLRIMELSLVVATLGFLVVSFSTSFTQSAAGFALVGLGSACLVPCGFSLAPAYSRVAAAQALGLLALITALPRIPAPLAFGDLAERISYPAAFALNAVLFCVAFGVLKQLKRLPLPEAMKG